ncbi:c-type cytochrome [Undibacterium sp. SXout11W]|uniref:c-type cytochrome n=1 Tax=Undibacterium sp. SXout11W TaxID=3413050 RepID=UPI003BF2B4F4
MTRTIKYFMSGMAILIVGLGWYVYAVGYRIHDDVNKEHTQNRSNLANEIALNEQIKRGEYLTRVGNCAGCHTARGGALYAGGKLIPSEFGNFISPNITPDVQTGIGGWTEDDFWRALHFGKARDGSLLYPAFPYPNYTLVSRGDSDAMFAYLKSIPAVSQISQSHQLAFPYNQRALLSVWRTLYFKPHNFETVPEKSNSWNRGAYLVNGLGHCSACHSSRNTLGANAGTQDLDGGPMPGIAWYAPSLLRMNEAHLAKLSETEANHLFNRAIASNAVMSGPMAEVFANSLQYLVAADVDAMTIYLRSLASKPDSIQSYKTEYSQQVFSQLMTQGAALYKTHCADCHGNSGEGISGIYPALKENNSVTMPSIANPIRIILTGGFPPVSRQYARPYGMPPFGPVLDDNEVALVLTFVRNSWGNQASVVTVAEVNRYRNAPVN